MHRHSQINMNKTYIEKREGGGLYIKDTRVSLDSVVYVFNRGESPESIVQSFSFLTLEQVYGAVTYYCSRKFRSAYHSAIIKRHYGD